MRSRCNSNAPYIAIHYKDRGITVCEEWKKDFLVFKKFAESVGYADDLWIDRIDPRKGYYPENVRFVPRYISDTNKRPYSEWRINRVKLDE